MGPKDVAGMANSVDPDQTVGAVSSGSALFAQIVFWNFRDLPFAAKATTDTHIWWSLSLCTSVVLWSWYITSISHYHYFSDTVVLLHHIHFTLPLLQWYCGPDSSHPFHTTIISVILWSCFITSISHYHYFSGTVVLLHHIHFTLPLLQWYCGPGSSHPFHTTIISVILWSCFITSISHYHYFSDTVVLLHHIHFTLPLLQWYCGPDSSHPFHTTITSVVLWSWYITSISHYHYFSDTVVLLHHIHFTLPLLQWYCGPDSSHPFHTTITSVVLWSWFIGSISHYHYFSGTVVLVDRIHFTLPLLQWHSGPGSSHPFHTTITSVALWAWFITSISHYHYFSGTVVLVHHIHFTLPLLQWHCGPDSSHLFHTTITSVALWSWFITSISHYHYFSGTV